jgi:uncharacterized membrane protein YcjF (UPF0283 family)
MNRFGLFSVVTLMCSILTTSRLLMPLGTWREPDSFPKDGRQTMFEQQQQQQLPTTENEPMNPIHERRLNERLRAQREAVEAAQRAERMFWCLMISLGLVVLTLVVVTFLSVNFN